MKELLRQDSDSIMKLRLELKNPSSFPGAPSNWVLHGNSMVIGRSEQSDWALPDPERVISKQHCRIEWSGQRFVIIDMSVNGLRMNGLPVSRGLPQPLDSGSVLQIGKAVIHVSIAAEPASGAQPATLIPADFIPVPVAAPPHPAPVPHTPPAASPTPSIPFSNDGPFGGTSDVPVTAAPENNPDKPAVNMAVGAAVMQDWWNPEAQSSIPSPAQGDSPKLAPAAASQVISGQGELVTLLRKSESVSAVQLAQYIEEAAQVLPQEQRNNLLKRLEELVREAAG